MTTPYKTDGGVTSLSKVDSLPNPSERSTLQHHVEFWDPQNTGIITPWQTYAGFYSLGFGVILSAVAVAVINGTMSYPTQSPAPALRTKNIFDLVFSIPAFLWAYIPDPFFRIHIANIHRDKHGSSSMSYDRKGRFEKRRFDEIFDLYSADPNHDGLTFWEGLNMVGSWRFILDFYGLTATILEWLATYYLLFRRRDAHGRVSKQDIKGVFDGSIFPIIAERRKAGYAS